MKKIGFIGLGIMGQPMCANLIKGGFEVMAYDVDREKVKAMEGKGAKGAAALAEIAAYSEAVVIMVPKSEHVSRVITGLLPDLREGTLIVDMSTISPLVSRGLAEKVTAQKCHMIDAPVVKSRAAAEAGELGILVGGPRDLFEKAQPLLKCIGSEIIHMGENGNGLVMKLCHNMLVAEIQNGVNEMLLLAQRAGLDFDTAVRAVRAGGGQNFYLDAKAESIKNEDFSPKFPFEHMEKDLALTSELTNSLKITLPGAELSRSYYTAGMEKGYARLDFSAAFKCVKEKAEI